MPIYLFSWEPSLITFEYGILPDSDPSYKQMIIGEETHPLITFIASAMVSNTVDSL